MLKGSTRAYNNYKYPPNIGEILTYLMGGIYITIILGHFNTPAGSMDRASRQNQLGNSGIEWYIRPDGLNIYIEHSIQ